MAAKTGAVLSRSQTRSRPLVLAAGGVMWRFSDDELQVLLVHREKFRDWSFPKGKVDPGETLPETAVRELEEETGIRGHLGPALSRVQYHMPSGREKVVHYWAVEATPDAVSASTFRPNKEIADLEWMGIDDARGKLSYPVDREVLRAFEQLVAADGLGTFAVVLMRHGQAAPGSSVDGPDSVRPLTPRGAEQARAAVGPLRAFGVERIVASSAVRCQETVMPLSQEIGKRTCVVDALSQAAWEQGDDDVASIVDKRIRKAKGAVLCSHSPVIPAIMETVAQATGTRSTRELRDASSLRTGSFAVVHVRRGRTENGIVAIETHSPLDERSPES
ncbi:NUDIX hydrolase [Microbacterium karelineae]|uniref:NUDIX hydrolase n=1 Tax=Microbacterium karelineae TaxID=2654283 RepID=UPI001E56A146|nr:NUDIX hydrolase [Microbacterium karelineae]